MQISFSRRLGVNWPEPSACIAWVAQRNATLLSLSRAQLECLLIWIKTTCSFTSFRPQKSIAFVCGSRSNIGRAARGTWCSLILYQRYTIAQKAKHRIVTQKASCAFFWLKKISALASARAAWVTSSRVTSPNWERIYETQIPHQSALTSIARQKPFFISGALSILYGGSCDATISYQFSSQ